MSKDNTTFADIITKVLAKKWQVILITAAITIIGMVYVVSLPRMYTAKSVIVAEKRGQSASALGMLGGLGLGGGAGSEGVSLELAPAIVESVPFLLGFKDVQVALVNDPQKLMVLGEYLSRHQKSPWWRFSSKIKAAVDSDQPTNAYSLSTSDMAFVQGMQRMFLVTKEKKFNTYELSAQTQDPLVSAILVDSLTVRIQKYLTLYQTKKAAQELAQSLDMANEARTRYYAIQEKYANMLDRNKNLISEGALSKLDRVKTEVNITYQAYSASAQQVEAARTKLLENTPVFTIITPPYLDSSPTYPNRKLFVIVSFLLGIFIGVGSVILGDVKKLIFSNNSQDEDTASN